jgi:hypothetical protein
MFADDSSPQRAILEYFFFVYKYTLHVCDVIKVKKMVMIGRTLQNTAGHIDHSGLLAEDGPVEAEHAGEQANKVQCENVHHAHQEEEGVAGVLPAVAIQRHADGDSKHLKDADCTLFDRY